MLRVQVANAPIMKGNAVADCEIGRVDNVEQAGRLGELGGAVGPAALMRSAQFSTTTARFNQAGQAPACLRLSPLGRARRKFRSEP